MKAPNNQPTEAAPAQRKKRQGFFGIPKAALQTLIDQKASAAQISAYLTLARYTDKSHRFSTAGIKAVKIALRAGDQKASRLLQELTAFQVSLPDPSDRRRRQPIAHLIYDPAEWAKVSKESVPEAVGRRDQVRHVLNTFDGQMVYFANSLVDGLRSDAKPLANLCVAGDVAARLLLLMYRDNDMETWSGVHPAIMRRHYSLSNFDPDEEAEEPLESTYGKTLWGVERGNPFTQWEAFNVALGYRPENQKEAEGDDKRFWDALHALEDFAFVYEAAIAFNQAPEKHQWDAQMLYPLRTFDRRGRAGQAEPGVFRIMSAMARRWGCDPFDGYEEQSYGNRYAILVPSYIQRPAVVGVYRLRYRPHTDQNARAFAILSEGERQAIEWVRDVAPDLPALREHKAGQTRQDVS